MAVSVRIADMTKSFGTMRAVDNMSLEVRPGELFFLLGPSGCGKTTLLRCIAGFYEPDHGSVFLGDRDITRVPPHQRDTGMVFQSYALWPHMTVAENVAFGLQMRKVPRIERDSRVSEVLRLVRMDERASDRPNQLSGGQQQRVALARALVVHPQCLLLDEPLSNLDAKLRLEMRTEIRRICKEAGLTAIYVTHDQKEALSMADRLAVLDEGRIRQVGQPQDVYLHPCSSFVADFIGETNFMRGEVTSTDGDRTTVRTEIGALTSAGERKGIATGDHVTVCCRPEAIRLLHTGTGKAGDIGPNRFSGVLHDTVYLGEVAQHELDIQAGPAPRHGPDPGRSHVTLKAFELNPRVVARDTARNIDFCIDPADVVLLGE